MTDATVAQTASDPQVQHPADLFLLGTVSDLRAEANRLRLIAMRLEGQAAAAERWEEYYRLLAQADAWCTANPAAFYHMNPWQERLTALENELGL